MTPAARKLWLLAALIAAVTVIACLAAGPDLLAAYAEQKLIAMINRGPLAVTSKGLKIGLGGVSAAQVRVFYARYLTGLDLETLRITPSWSALRGPALPLRFSAQIYQGSITGIAGIPFPGGGMRLDMNLRDVDLAAHPQLQSLGLASGKLSADFAGTLPAAGRMPAGKFGLELTGLSIPRATTLPPELTGQSIFVPRIMNFSLALSGEAAGELLNIGKLVSLSQFGEVRGGGSIRLQEGGKKAAYDLQFELKPSADGQALLPLLKSALGRSSPPEPAGTAASWRVIVKGEGRPLVEFQPLQAAQGP